MSDENSSAGVDDHAPPKRSDVGYKRPPREQQFKKGQKPPPRKPKPSKDEPERPADLLWRLMHEERRVKLGKQVVWVSNAELIIRMVLQLADAGGAKMERLANELLMLGTSTETVDEGPIYTLERGEPWPT